MVLFKGKERAREQAPVLVVEEGVGVDEDEGDSSSEAASSDGMAGWAALLIRLPSLRDRTAWRTPETKARGRSTRHRYHHPYVHVSLKQGVKSRNKQDEEMHDEETRRVSTQSPSAPRKLPIAFAPIYRT